MEQNGVQKQTHKYFKKHASGKAKVLPVHGAETTRQSYGKKKIRLNTSYHTEDEIVINLNIKMRDLKLLEKNKGDYLHDLKGDRKIYVTKIITIKQTKKP